MHFILHTIYFYAATSLYNPQENNDSKYCGTRFMKIHNFFTNHNKKKKNTSLMNCIML